MPPVKKTTPPKKVSVTKKVTKKASKASKAPPVKESTAPVKESTAPVKESTAPVKESPAPVQAASVDIVSNYGDEFVHLLSQLKSLTTTLKDLTVYTAKLEKRVFRDQKAVQKRVNGKRRRAPSTGNPSGFSKPGPVSDELRTFLKLDKDTLIARTEVTKHINAYCKGKGLQGEKDKRILLPDKALTKLLRIKKGDQLTFFNLQRYMKIHFPNKEGVYPTA